MQTTIDTKDIDQLLTEADELIQQIQSDAIKDMEEAHRIQFEKHAERLKGLKSKVGGKIEKDGTLESGTYGEGHARGDCRYYNGHEKLGRQPFLVFRERRAEPSCRQPQRQLSHRFKIACRGVHRY